MATFRGSLRKFLQKFSDLCNWDFAWMNVGGVCRHWRGSMLASSRLWTPIDISQPDSPLEFLKRSKSAPLQITRRRYPSDFEQFKKVAEAVMKQISRLESLNIATIQGDDLLQFLRLNGDVNATVAAVLEGLRIFVRPSSSTALSNILHRNMTSLGHPRNTS
ncbi:hypothetical protein BDN71DRAFT_1448252 [Pleurotus eryngii]|uniref:F-box domain-containing protein n=1 Tax=Pleurotus eryngii TaxID=5323 RepID=A0A9P6DGC4_PLEER|nr:hypothetical protein BDN71DRAFT_1448252 [Pleurotus eryngii]